MECNLLFTEMNNTACENILCTRFPKRESGLSLEATYVSADEIKSNRSSEKWASMTACYPPGWAY